MPALSLPVILFPKGHAISIWLDADPELVEHMGPAFLGIAWAATTPRMCLVA